MAAVVCMIVVCGTGSASAQVFNFGDKVFVNLNVAGGGGTSDDASRQFSMPYFDETATIDTSRSVRTGGAFFDFMAGAKAVDNWTAGISFSRRSGKSNGSFAGSVPDLAEFDQPRSVSGTIADMEHKETWFALLGGYSLPKVTNLPKFLDKAEKYMKKVDLMVFAGPVRAAVTHEVVSSVEISEGPSGPVVTVNRETISKSFWGIQVGVDARYMVTSNFGAGVFLRYSGASGDINDEVNLDLGGFQGGLGLRIRF
ncbi:MAG TPA: hypothetical protein VES67_14300 [Vicinamibacterales bacterium]|nr:hypothetical protein [Vicinamibacterales bacterium]